uniref:Uncharacterized protein n=1 Tax=Strigamia maritima TaxID=126957 RepID=T1J3D3_STRMM
MRGYLLESRELLMIDKIVYLEWFIERTIECIVEENKGPIWIAIKPFHISGTGKVLPSNSQLLKIIKRFFGGQYVLIKEKSIFIATCCTKF